jgi:TatA/E family protein of Tat protein translocase
MGPLGLQETIVIFVLALLIFGPKKLPELGKTIGKAMTEFRRASSELKATWDREMTALEREQETLKQETRKIEGEVSSAYHDDGYGSYDYDSGYNYGSESYPSTASDSSTVSATEPQGADQTAVETAANGETAADSSSADSASPGQDAPAVVAEAEPTPPANNQPGTVSEPVRS